MGRVFKCSSSNGGRSRPQPRPVIAPPRCSGYLLQPDAAAAGRGCGLLLLQKAELLWPASCASPLGASSASPTAAGPPSIPPGVSSPASQSSATPAALTGVAWVVCASRHICGQGAGGSGAAAPSSRGNRGQKSSKQKVVRIMFPLLSYESSEDHIPTTRFLLLFEK